jgi:C-terminal processing protease CtpA/Prc
VRTPIRFLSLILLALVCTAQTTTSQVPLVNAGFEQGTVGGPLPGWNSGSPQYAAEISDLGCNSGKQCGLLRFPGTGTPDNFGNISQAINAVPYRGKKVRYRAAVRVQGSPQDRTQLWMRVDRQGGAVGFFDNMNDRPIQSLSLWFTYEITGDVDADATTLLVGMLMRGTARAWIDDVSVEVIGDADPLEAPRSLTSRGLQNLQALTRLFGYIRYFHPSDESASTDWTRVSIEAVRAVEPAQTPQELADRLRGVFQNIAPSARIHVTGSAPPALDLKPAEQVVFWQHTGVGVSARSIYRSTRVVQTAVRSADVLQPLRADLPGGVSVIVPLALYGEYPAPIPPSVPSVGRPVGSGNDRATRLAAVMIAWNVFEHFYPYFDVAGTDWAEVLRSSLTAAAEDKDADQFATTLRRMVAALRDGHGGVAGGSNTAWAAPPIVWTSVSGRVVALFSVGAQTPVSPGDALISIDGRPVADVLAEKERLISGATPQWIRYRALGELITRTPGSTVQVEIEPFAEPNTRRTVTLRATAAPVALAEEPRGNKVRELEPGIYYLDLNRVTDADFAAALPSLLNAKGIVFDMRGYPRLQNVTEFFGHLTDKLVTSAQWNVPVVTKPDHENMQFVRQGEWQLRPIAPYFTAKRAFITDGRAISYAESVMGIVEYFKLGEIVGEPTAGTNGNVNPFPVPGGYTITWTGMKVLKQDGSRHHGVGVIPTIPVSRTRAGIAAGRDEMLERAIQAVK